MIYLEYTKQNFYTGQKLLASHLNHIEDGIANIRIDASLTNADQAADAKTVGDTINKLTTKIDKNTEDVNKNTKSVTSLNQSVSQLKDELDAKLDKPETAPEVGKILKVTAVNDDGTFVCGWLDCAVKDFKLDSYSILNPDGTIYLKMGSGLRSYNINFIGISMGTNRDAPAVETIANRNFDLAVKKAMCDPPGTGKYSQSLLWTDAERISALLRMGCTVDDNGFVKWTAQEVAE